MYDISTVLIICCSPEEAQAQETLSTLKFGECAKRVTTFASANVVAAPDEVAAQLAELRAEVVRLKRQVNGFLWFSQSWRFWVERECECFPRASQAYGGAVSRVDRSHRLSVVKTRLLSTLPRSVVLRFASARKALP